MLSRMGGRTQGIAKNAQPVIVKLPDEGFPLSAIIDGLKAVLLDIGFRRKRAVVSMSLYIYPSFLRDVDPGTPEAYNILRKLLANMLRLLTDRGVLVVTVAGNEDKVIVDPFIILRALCRGPTNAPS